MTMQNAPAGTAPATSTATLARPAPVAAPAPVNRLAAVIAVLVLAAGIGGSILHTGLFFIPALVVLAVGGVKLSREQSGARREVLAMTGYLTRDRVAIVAALAAPLAAAAVLLPFRASWPDADVARCIRPRHPAATSVRGRHRHLPGSLVQRGGNPRALRGVSRPGSIALAP